MQYKDFIMLEGKKENMPYNILVKYSYKYFGQSFVNYLGPVMYFNCIPCQYKKIFTILKVMLKKLSIIGCFSISLSPSYNVLLYKIFYFTLTIFFLDIFFNFYFIHHFFCYLYTKNKLF